MKKETSMDLRVIRTRHFIQEAFFGLILEKGFEPITVRDITERAMINRSTFYRHFEDKYDLARKSLDETFAALLKQLDESVQVEGLPEGQPPKNFLILLAHIEQNAELYKMLFGRHGISIFASRFREYILQVLHFRLGHLIHDGWRSEIPIAVFEEYLSGAYMGVIQWWLDNIREYSAEKVALWLYQLVVQGTVSAMNWGDRDDPFREIP